jgi:hypothetical protein
VTGTTSHRPLSAGRLGGRDRVPFPERPVLTAPPSRQHSPVADTRRLRLAAQPWIGLGGLLLTAVVFFVLALGTGSAATGLLILGPIATFGLAGVAMIAFWWNDWPGSRLSAPWTGVVDTLLAAAIAVVLTIAGQVVVERPAIGAVFEATPGPAAPTTFPATMALAGATFTAMVQLSLVCERWPLSRLGRLWSGIAALVLSWLVGAGAYFLFVNISYLPVAERVAAGLRDPGGPVTRTDFGAALIAVGVWQAVLFIALRGWPINTITRRSRRLLAGNTLVIGLGAGSYAAMHDAAGLSPGTIGAVCGCVIGAVLVVAMLFEGWPAALLRPAAGRALTLALTAVVALVLYRALAAYADGVRWIRAAPDDWIASASLSFAGAGVILHVGIGLRWPFAGLRRDAVAQRLPDDLHPALRAELAEDAGDIGLDGTS